MSGDQIKPGYKRTELGMIPEDWLAVNLNAVCTMKSGEGITAERIDDFSAYPCYGGNGLRGYTSRYTHDGRFALIGRQGALCGNVNSAQGKFYASEHAVVVTPKAGIDITFLTYALGRMRLNRYTESSAQPGLSVSKVLALRLSVPGNELEQRTIADTLSSVDAVLAKLDQLIAKKRDLKQAAMQQLLTGQTRLPGFSGEWEVKRLGDVADMGSGGTPLSSVAAYYDGDIPWVSISDMTKGGKVIEFTERNLTELGFANSAAQMFPAGTVLYAMYASLGECSIAGIPLCTSQAILGIRPRDKLHGEFLFYYLTSLKATVKNLGQQGTQANLNKGMVQNFRLSLPTVEEQTAIATVLSEMDAELAALEDRRDKTRAIKQGMMQELLTGRIRLR
ncbi:restriction endonuclease subunit S [Roseateles sp.]|jgi:type I restriction enzyme S subunit|uniref:restriction endonuclease subunit S n=1 Tax=Roseateles sp. TaxID=1971397 RepID=UPI0037CBA5DB